MATAQFAQVTGGRSGSSSEACDFSAFHQTGRELVIPSLPLSQAI